MFFHIYLKNWDHTFLPNRGRIVSFPWIPWVRIYQQLQAKILKRDSLIPKKNNIGSMGMVGMFTYIQWLKILGPMAN